jgi:hypothetical protein
VKVLDRFGTPTRPIEVSSISTLSAKCSALLIRTCIQGNEWTLYGKIEGYTKDFSYTLLAVRTRACSLESHQSWHLPGWIAKHRYYTIQDDQWGEKSHSSEH